ncbi:AbrB/MazE/SpoVT family DNA-binding domain-containing protein [Phosphitispora fastidiosa]|uniref:AbrB/MazE/SpoVT family DNA-binding domain-containing protein n=1 Tax=Phosphitispora fastidiosa TaxID=2837202 RepID=UPI002F3EDCC7|nr:AbrB family looped-hinge helix DNA binding protein [Phosphitispora fastidiosa]
MAVSDNKSAVILNIYRRRRFFIFRTCIYTQKSDIILCKENLTCGKSKESKGGILVELARLSSKGQITIPIEIRKKLNLKEGDKVLFLEENGNIIIANSALVALREFQQAMAGEAEKQGLHSEENINQLVKEIRSELWNEKYENND